MKTITYNPETHQLVPVDLLRRCREFIDTTLVPPYPHGADTADELDRLLAAAPQQEEREVSASLAWQDCEAALLSAHDHLGKALRIPTTPWPDPGAHGHEAAGRAIHASYCAVRFAVMDAIGALTAARCALAAAASESAMDEPRRCRREPRGNGEYVCDCKAGDCSEAHQPPPAQAEGQEAVGDGWLQDGGLLYRLTDGRRPENRDEINVTMADGSRSAESRTRRAGELLDRIRSTTPPRREWVKSTLEEKVILLLQHGCGERIPLLEEFEELLKGKNHG